MSAHAKEGNKLADGIHLIEHNIILPHKQIYRAVCNKMITFTPFTNNRMKSCKLH